MLNCGHQVYSPEEAPTRHRHCRRYGTPFLDHPVLQVDVLRKYHKINKSVETGALNEARDNYLENRLKPLTLLKN